MQKVQSNQEIVHNGLAMKLQDIDMSLIDSLADHEYIRANDESWTKTVWSAAGV